jgi:hypothetical protein
MLGFPLGILSAAGAGVGAVGDYELISTTILGSTTADVVFDVSSLGSTYKHLQIRMVARGSGATTSTRDLYIRLNGSTTNYSAHSLRGTGSGVSSTATTGATVINQEAMFVGNSNTANIFGAAVIDILDPFSTTKNTTVRTLLGHTSSTNRVALSSGAFYSTAAITSVTIFPESDSILAGSRFSIYGIKG